jgi:hypothetical protein
VEKSRSKVGGVWRGEEWYDETKENMAKSGEA